MVKIHSIIWTLLLTSSLFSCESKLDFGSRFGLDPSKCPVFDLKKMEDAGISLPALIDGFLIAAPTTTLQCNGITGYRSLYVYSHLVPSGDLQIHSDHRNGVVKAKLNLAPLPLSDKIQEKLRDRLKVTPELFNSQGSFIGRRPLSDLDSELVLTSLQPFSMAKYADHDKKFVEFNLGSDLSEAQAFAQSFNEGREKIELIHNASLQPDSGLASKPLFFMTSLSHPNQSLGHALTRIEPSEVLAKIWARAITEDQKREILSGAADWLARVEPPSMLNHPAMKETLDFCKLTWNPYPANLDPWTVVSMRWLSQWEESSPARNVFELYKTLIKSGEDGDFALTSALEIIKNETYGRDEIQKVLHLSKKIRETISEVEHPWAAARQIFDQLGRDWDRSERAVGLSSWLAEEHLFRPKTEVTCFDEAITTSLLGLTLEQVRPIYREMIQWVNLSPRKDFVWIQTKEWALKYHPTHDQLLTIRQFYSWLISVDGMAWDVETALIVSQRYVFGPLQASSAQLNLVRDAIKWLRSPDGPHIVAPDSLMSKAQLYVFDNKMNPGTFESLKARYQALVNEGLDSGLALTQAETEILG